MPFHSASPWNNLICLYRSVLLWPFQLLLALDLASFLPWYVLVGAIVLDFFLLLFCRVPHLSTPIGSQVPLPPRQPHFWVVIPLLLCVPSLCGCRYVRNVSMQTSLRVIRKSEILWNKHSFFWPSRSGIMAVLFAGITMAHYTHHNMTPLNQVREFRLFMALES